MAGHLLAAGHRLTVYTRTESKARPLLDKGAQWAASPAEAARGAQAVFLCLPDTPDVRQVAEGKQGLLEAGASGQVIVDHSTISPVVTRELAERAEDKGVHFLDAPISGGDVGARNGTLSIMVGGDADALARVRPLLSAYGKSIVHCGPSGAGQLTKLTNQIVVSLTNLAVCEGLRFASAQGLDPNKTIEAISGGCRCELAAFEPWSADGSPGFRAGVHGSPSGQGFAAGGRGRCCRGVESGGLERGAEAFSVAAGGRAWRIGNASTTERRGAIDSPKHFVNDLLIKTY